MVRHGAIVVMGGTISGPAAILRSGYGLNDRQRGGYDFQFVFGVSGGHHILLLLVVAIRLTRDPPRLPDATSSA